MTIELGPFPDAPGYEQAVEKDASDPLASFRQRFLHTDPDLIYLDGNSLGRLPVPTMAHLEDLVFRQWGDRLIRGWNEGWWDLQIRLGDLLAPLIGASPGEVLISDSTSVNLYKLAWAAVKARPDRDRIVTDDLNFPTDVYVLDGVARELGLGLEIVPSDAIHGPVEGLTAALDHHTALLALSHTVFKSGYTYEMAALSAKAKEVGAMTLWDLSHSAGSVPIDLHRAGVDLAVGCTYKYLNGGPGSPAFLYVRSGLQERLHSPITAWWGHEEPFAFDLDFRPTAGIRRFHTGTMPILSLAAVEPGLDLVAEAGVEAIRAKSIALTSYLIELWEEVLSPLGFSLGSPSDQDHRGSHVSLTHREAWPISQALIKIGSVIPDFRVPDSIRFGLAPLYTRFVDVHTAVHRCRQIAESGAYSGFVDAPAVVT